MEIMIIFVSVRNLGGCNENILCGEAFVLLSLRLVNLENWKVKRNIFALKINELVSMCDGPPSVTYRFIMKDSSIIFSQLKI